MSSERTCDGQVAAPFKTVRRRQKKKPEEFWILIRKRHVVSVNWACYDADSVYIGLSPRKGDKVIRVREVTHG